MLEFILARKNLFSLRKENEAIKDRIIRDFRNLFSRKNILTNQQEQVVLRATTILHMKVTEIEVKHYQLNNIFIKLDHN